MLTKPFHQKLLYLQKQALKCFRDFKRTLQSQAYNSKQYRQMSNQNQPNSNPFNPFMHPFIFPFYPPNYPFLNPMHPPPFDFHHSQERYQPPPSHMLPPFGMPHFPMMFPPMPYDRMHPVHDYQGRMKEADIRKRKKNQRQGIKLKQQERKRSDFNEKQHEKNKAQVIVLSDDEVENPRQNININNDEQNQKESSHNDYVVLPRPRRTQRKLNIQPKIENKHKIIEKKRDQKLMKEMQKSLNYDLKESKYIESSIVQSRYDLLNRSNRIKYMSIKNGKGKINIGESYQAKIPPFVRKNQNYSIWLMQKKKKLLLRIQSC